MLRNTVSLLVLLCGLVWALVDDACIGEQCMAKDESCQIDEAGCQNSSDEVAEVAVSLLQSGGIRGRGERKYECTSPSCCILVLTTPGARTPCCGEKASRCGLLKGHDVQKMALAFERGVRNTTTHCQVDIADISKDCPHKTVVKGYDAIVVNVPSYGGAMSPDMHSFIYDLGLDGFECKIGSVIARGGAYYTGAQPVMEQVHRILQQKQMYIIGGANWNTGEGAAEIVGSWPFDSNAAPHVIFEIDAEALGARVANLTKSMAKLPGLCGSSAGAANAPSSNPYYALAQSTTSAKDKHRRQEWPYNIPEPAGSPSWPGWQGVPGNRTPPYTSLYKSNFSWMDPTCGASRDLAKKIIIITTAGANGGGKLGACCGCPDPADGKRCGCFRHTGDRTLQLAQAVRWGIGNTTGGCAHSGVAVDIFDLTQNTSDVTGESTGCPSWDFVKQYDVFLFASPSWNGLPPSDILAYTNLWPLNDVDLRCKPAAAFSSSAGYSAGGEMVIESLKRMAMTFQMISIPGPYWSIGEGVVANTGTWPYTKYVETDDGDDLSVSPYFLNQAWALGVRVANVTKGGHWKDIKQQCDVYPRQVDANRR